MQRAEFTSENVFLLAYNQLAVKSNHTQKILLGLH